MTSSKYFPTWLVALSIILIALTSSASTSHDVEFELLPGTATWSTDGIYDSLILVVGEPGDAITETQLEVAGSVSFGLTDDEGNYRPDGIYAYELRGKRGQDDATVVLDFGYFKIAGGSFVSPDLKEDALEKQLFLEDLFVQGSTCIGLDCVDGENFAFDTLRLKENNLRIHFQDTSNSAEFATTDWRLTANDTDNGGASHFSIEDATAGTTPFRILGEAPNNALYIDDDGKVGFGTNVPAVDLHNLNGNTPTLRLHQDNSEGFTPQIWDIAGNEANFFIRDVTNDSKLPFKIKPGAGDNSLVIDDSGDVAIGALNPNAKLDVRGDIAVSGTVDGRDLATDGSTLDAHVADFDNPHQVTAEQVGADPAGTAAALITDFEANFDGGITTPVAIADGGTGATDAATARANLGIVDEEIQSGILFPGAFGTNPASATVTLQTPYSAGTTYAVLLTAYSKSINTPLYATVIRKGQSSFDIALSGSADDLMEISWMTRPAAVQTSVAISSPTSGSSYEPSESFQVSYSLAAADGVRVYLGGAAQFDNFGSGPITVTAPSADGTYELRLEALDANGTELGSSASISIEVSTAPVAGLSCALLDQNVWNTGYTLNYTVTNEGSETISAWDVVVQFAETANISNSWNAQLSIAANGTTVDATNVVHNGTLAPGASTSFGFQGSHDGSFEIPTCSDN